MTFAYSIAVDPTLARVCDGLLERHLPPTLLGMLDVAETDGPVPGRTCLAQLMPLGAGADEAKRLSESGHHGLPVIEVDPDHPELLAERVTALLVERLQRSETAAAASREAAALLRRENISGAGRFREIESFLYALGNPHVAQSLNWEPSGAVAELPADGSVVQHLPLNIVSITAIDLWLPERLHVRNCEIRVSLQDSSGDEHALAEIPDEMRIGSGWVRFALPMALQGDARNCSLILRNAGPARLMVGLGMRMPDARFTAQGDTMPGDQVLALRVWKALAGASIPERRDAPMIDPRLEMTASLLQPSALPAPEIFGMPSSATDYITADFWAAEDAIMVHPSRSGAVCAVIRDVPMRGLLQLSAVVNTGHARSPNLNFAIGVTPHRAIGRDGIWESCMGSWVHGLPANGWGQVHCVPKGPIERADIYLATSLAQDMPNEHSWGLFRSFRAVTGQRATQEE
ncbi:hypothetical protein E4L95_02895 [Paracoccus liaowanqingii]|uniref:Uncharacterized protein n=1 Tax=Paracoccus liaowanqingii TaxID=2560053 RepID=A0A4Z1CS41_9RHOB|nr:DUF6212 domain-containing protein [Paracoccus liaowanqingii]TGN68016.1 hypothetical protein E4L95_02895 [Paracoccus liaowanqingii]